MEKIFINTESTKTNGPHTFALNLSQILDLRAVHINMFLFKIYLFITRGKI